MSLYLFSYLLADLVNRRARSRSQLHEGVIHLLYNLRMAVGRGVSTLLLNLLLDPKVCLAQTVLDFDGGFPAEFFHDELVVGVAPANSHRPVDVLDGELLVLEGQRNLGELDHVDHFGATKIEGDATVGEHEPQDPLDAVVDEGEAPRLLAVAPHLKVLRGRDGLAAEGGGSLLAAALPSPARSVDVVEARDADVHGEVPAVRERHLLGVKLLEAVHVLGAGRPRVGFDQTRIVGIFLLGFVVHASAGGVEEVLHFVAAGGLEHVHGDGRVVEGQDRLVGDNESHPTHVGGQVVHLGAALTSLAGDLELAQIVVNELVAELVVLHELVGLPVNDDHMPAGLLQPFRDVRSDEAGAPADAHLAPVALRQRKGG